MDFWRARRVTAEGVFYAPVVRKAVSVWGPRRKGSLVVNGLTGEECDELNVAYTGLENWLEKLGTFGVQSYSVELLHNAPNTAAESKMLLLMAREKGWATLTIMSYPYHILRCFLQIISLMEESGIWLRVHCQTFQEVEWTRPMAKPVMKGAEPVFGKLPEHIAAEFQRIITYAQEPPLENGKPKYTRHATIPEMFGYLERREEERPRRARDIPHLIQKVLARG